MRIFTILLLENLFIVMTVDKKFIKWYFTQSCDLGCTFCHNAYNRRTWNTDLLIESSIKIAENLRSSRKIAGLTFLGGEPTYSDAFILASDAMRGADFKFGVVTAGHKLGEERLERIYSNPNLGFIGISLDSLDGNLVKKIRKRDVFDSQYLGLKETLNQRAKSKSSYEIYINTILTNENANEMIGFLDHMCELGVNKVKILSYNIRDRGLKAADQLKIDQERLFKISRDLAKNHDHKIKLWTERGFHVEYNFLSALAKDYLNKVHGHNLPLRGHLCPISRNTVFLANDGKLFACEYLKPYFGIDDLTYIGPKHEICNLLDKSFDKAITEFYFKSTFYTVASSELYSNLRPCNECSHLFINCVPCGLKGVDRDQIVTNEHCEYYKKKHEKSGTFISRSELKIRLREPIKKHKGTN